MATMCDAIMGVRAGSDFQSQATFSGGIVKKAIETVYEHVSLFLMTKTSDCSLAKYRVGEDFIQGE